MQQNQEVFNCGGRGVMERKRSIGDCDSLGEGSNPSVHTTNEVTRVKGELAAMRYLALRNSNMRLEINHEKVTLYCRVRKEYELGMYYAEEIEAQIEWGCSLTARTADCRSVGPGSIPGSPAK